MADVSAMTVPVLSVEPEVIRAGDTVTWTRDDATYSPAAGWTLTYYFRGAGSFDVSTTGSGTRYTATLTAANSAALTAGLYTWIARAAKGTDAVTVAEGRCTVARNVATAVAGDLQTWAEKTLAVVEAVLSGQITDGIADYRIGEREVTKIPLDELFALRNRLRLEVAAERSGGAFGAPVRVAFARPGAA